LFSVFPEIPHLGVQRAIPAIFGAALLILGSASMAAEYRPDEFLSLDLSKAVLSPTPLGPQTEFAKVPVEANSEPSGVLPHADTRQVPVAKVRAAPERAALAPAPAPAPAVRRESGMSRANADRRHGAARVKLAHRHHGDPLNAQAMDTRIQKWPCRSGGGGICAWKR
jgi:hypothetical protein